MAIFEDVTDKNHLQLTTLAYLRIIHQRKFAYIIWSSWCPFFREFYCLWKNNWNNNPETTYQFLIITSTLSETGVNINSMLHFGIKIFHQFKHLHFHKITMGITPYGHYHSFAYFQGELKQNYRWKFKTNAITTVDCRHQNMSFWA